MSHQEQLLLLSEIPRKSSQPELMLPQSLKRLFHLSLLLTTVTLSSLHSLPKYLNHLLLLANQEKLKKLPSLRLTNILKILISNQLRTNISALKKLTDLLKLKFFKHSDLEILTKLESFSLLLNLEESPNLKVKTGKCHSKLPNNIHTGNGLEYFTLSRVLKAKRKLLKFFNGFSKTDST